MNEITIKGLQNVIAEINHKNSILLYNDRNV